ncbi:MAG: hypothetical protein H7210_00200, partial [Pyrinomonadaceae bacterium]|nr:hypothetical protein [Phycisphaerales bacterium]
YRLMSDTAEDGMFSGISTIITQEGNSLGYSASQRAAFTDLVFAVSKGGNYGLCSPACIYDQTRGGYVRLPFRAGCNLTPREFVYATFVNNATNDANAGAAASSAYNELLREQIRSAMQSWLTCTVDWNFDGFVNSQDFFDFLNDFFAGRADYNHDRFTNSQDFFDFITAFFNN